MRQRVSFLRTLVAGKEVLLLDEPFGALDSITRADLQQWLRSALDAEPRTTMLVTHDVEEALLIGERVVVMSARPGRVVAEFKVNLPHAGQPPRAHPPPRVHRVARRDPLPAGGGGMTARNKAGA